MLFIYITRLASNEIFSPSNEIHREVGRAKDLSASLIFKMQRSLVVTISVKFIPLNYIILKLTHLLFNVVFYVSEKFIASIFKV